MIQFIPKFEKLEICITYRCNVRCNNCGVQCTQAPCGVECDLSLQDIEKLLTESIEINKIWKEIRLTGGEPTLHKNLEDICKLLINYQKSVKECNYLGVLSNGVNQKQLDMVKALGLDVGVWYKDNNIQHPYDPINNSPTDRGIPYRRGCYIPMNCGQYFNYLGFFVCAPAAGAARVLNYNSLTKNVKDISIEKAIASYDEVCKHCVYSSPGYESGPVTCNRTKEPIITKTWDEALKTYNNKRKHD